jgi:RNA polymerase sigma-70 factor (ECF subfamily)
MAEEDTRSKLIQEAQRGREDCMSRLVHESRGRLCAYIYRVTLDHDLTEDLSQEILLQMVQSLGSLNQAERFWPWMYRIAQSKIQEHYKSKQRKKMISETAFYKDFLSQNGKQYAEDGLRQMLHEELSRKVMTAMKQIKQQYRAVLSLRCFEQLSYADIAQTMQCNEVTARVLFFRAKKAIKKQLAHQGLSRGLLLMCLGIFGKLTAPTKAAASTVTVTAASTKVGLTAAVLATAGSKLGIATIATVLTLAGIGIAVLPKLNQPPPNSLSTPLLPNRNEIKSLHFTTQLQNNDPNAGGSLSKGAYEQSFYFPDQINGPMFMRMQRWTPEQDQKLCSWLENGQGNYYYASDKNTVYIYNCRVCWSSLKVSRLPTDSEEFIDFLSMVEGDLPAFKDYTRDKQTGLLISSMDYRFRNAPNFITEYCYNTVGPERFHYDWPASIPVVDERDQMHQRGWTYFYINGALNGKEISGRGQIPFIYDTCKEHPAWMRLNIGNELEIIDCSAGAQLKRGDGTLITSYPVGSFFKGLARPWMGMHTADLIRRDAVEQHIWFHSERFENNEELVSITLDYQGRDSNTKLIYTIDMEEDVVNEIKFVVNAEEKGAITISYLQDINQVQNNFVEPALTEIPQTTIQQIQNQNSTGPGILWLIHLAQENLVPTLSGENLDN